jgi:CheY-like chemotaxis protein
MSVSILVVDDEPDIGELFRQRFRRELRSGDYVLHFAISGRDALALVTDGVEPTLLVLLSDINMPEMDGLQLLREVKRRRPDLPVIMITAYDDLERRRTADALGAVDFLNKPIDFDQLKQRIRAFGAEEPRA